MTEPSADDDTRIVGRHRADPAVPDDATRVVSRDTPDDATRVVSRDVPDDATVVVDRGQVASTGVASPGSAAPDSATAAFVPGGVTESATDSYAIRSAPDLPRVERTPLTGPPAGRARPADPRAVRASVARSGTRRGVGVIALVIGSTVVVAVIVAALAILVFGGLL